MAPSLTQLIPDDRPEERALFDAMHQALLEEYAPATMVETILVERIVICYWRMRRLVIAENQAIYSATQSDRVSNALFRQPPNPDPRAPPTHPTLALYSRHKVTLERQLYCTAVPDLRPWSNWPVSAASTVAITPVDPAGIGDACVAHPAPNEPPQPLQPLEFHPHTDHAALPPLPPSSLAPPATITPAKVLDLPRAKAFHQATRPPVPQVVAPCWRVFPRSPLHQARVPSVGATRVAHV